MESEPLDTDYIAEYTLNQPGYEDYDPLVRWRMRYRLGVAAMKLWAELPPNDDDEAGDGL